MRIHLLACCLLAARLAAAQSPYVPTAENLGARERFQDAKFGLFIHWGVYSVLQDGEWVMNNRGITAAEYESLPQHFAPRRFDPRAWVAAAKAAGMRYVVITSKHHDGIALWDSKVSDYSVPRRTPYGRDIIRELAEACREAGLPFYLYYSQLDWHHPDYFPRGQTGATAGRPERGDWNRYLDYLDAQLTELLTGYGPIGGIWLDGLWDKPTADWRLDRTYALIHRLQPATLIIPNNHEPPRPGEDVQTFEKDLPGANSAGFNTTTIGALPLETAQTTNETWGFRLHDRAWKSSRRLIQELAGAAGRGANYLLNVGPRPDGTIPEPSLAQLDTIGAWMRLNGASIHGTRRGPLTPRPWGVTTQRGDTVYVHLLEGADRVIALPALGRRVVRATLLATGEPVAVATTPEAVTLTLPRRDTASPDQVVALVLGR